MRWSHPLRAVAPGRGIIAIAVVLAGCGQAARAEEALPAPAAADFDADFLHGTGGAQVDVSRFARGNPVLPGSYLVDLTVNGQPIDRVRIQFRAAGARGDGEPCLDRGLLGKAGLDFGALARETRQRLAGLAADACIDPAGISPDIRVSFDQSRLVLALLVPQALVRRQARNFVAPELWDRGVMSATLRYDLDFYHIDTSTGPTDSGYLRLDSGINIGTWHFRQRSAVTLGSDGSRFDNVATYVVHDIPAITSRLTLGDTFTDGTVFDSLGMRGIVLGTDDRMRPDSRSGYAPTVRGIARTTARVRITQNGVLLLETTVSPGPFTIDDLYPTGYGGDLEVEVLEADGTRQAFAVPFAALLQMLRPGVLRYAVAGGEFRDSGVGTGEVFGQATVQYGLANRLTGYAGAQFADGYSAGLIGAAVNTPIGALAFDATVARSELPGGEPISGYSLRASLAKTIAASRTNLTFAALRYSSDGYLSLTDFLRQRAGRAAGSRQRERLQLNVSQDLPGDLGSLYLSGSVRGVFSTAGMSSGRWR